jgi:hypothetical protein
LQLEEIVIAIASMGRGLYVCMIGAASMVVSEIYAGFRFER